MLPSVAFGFGFARTVALLAKMLCLTRELEMHISVNASAAPRREDRRFIDGKWHTYGFEWHSGDEDVGTGQADSCTPRVDFFFDGE